MCCRTASTVASISARENAEPLHERFRHLRADPVVAVETDAAFLVDARGRRFADVVKEDAKDERE